MNFVAAVEDAERAQMVADLKAARAELVARGRCRYKSVAQNGQVCIKGALAVATGHEWTRDEAHEDVLTWLAKARRIECARGALEGHLGGGRMVWEFNDDRATTDQDVLDLFDKTLADLGGLA